MKIPIYLDAFFRVKRFLQTIKEIKRGATKWLKEKMSGQTGQDQTGIYGKLNFN